MACIDPRRRRAWRSFTDLRIESSIRRGGVWPLARCAAPGLRMSATTAIPCCLNRRGRFHGRVHRQNVRWDCDLVDALDDLDNLAVDSPVPH